MSSPSQAAHQTKETAQNALHQAEQKVSQLGDSMSQRASRIVDYTKRSAMDKPVLTGTFALFLAFAGIPLLLYAAFASTVIGLVAALIVVPALAFGGLFLGGALLFSALAAGTVAFWAFMTFATFRFVVNLMSKENLGAALSHWMTECRDALIGHSDPSWRQDAKHAKDQAASRVAGRG